MSTILVIPDNSLKNTDGQSQSIQEIFNILWKGEKIASDVPYYHFMTGR